MKTKYALLLFLFTSTILFGQGVVKPDTSKHVAKLDTINPNLGNVKKQLDTIKARKIKLHSDTIGSDSLRNQPRKSSKVDTIMQNKYGDLLKDDPMYNKRYSIWRPAVEVIGENVALSLVDSKILNLGFSKVGPVTWKRTLNAGWPWGNGWEWDQDRFGNNFLSHPIMGNFYFNAARANGYNFWASTGFAFAGSYMWKIFGENGTPEREDLFNTTFDGMVLGEILYRISSNILDDRTTGVERVLREIAAGIIDPIRGFNRLIQGKCSRITNKEIYAKEPLNFTLEGGLHIINNNTSTAIGSSTYDEMLGLQVDYGNPFEVRNRSPFDFFQLRGEFNFGEGRKVVDNITGYGILFGRNVQVGKLAMLIGAFQYYDYWDKKTLELATIAFGGGVYTKYPISKSILLYTNVDIAAIPLAGNSMTNISDTSQSRDYSFGYGGEAKIKSTLILGKYATIGVSYSAYLIHCFNNTGHDELATGTLGNNVIGIFRPFVTVRLYKDLSIGYEHLIYTTQHIDNNASAFYDWRTEQKLFLVIYLEDAQRRGHYN
jgi:hypothetical protein